MKIKDIAHGQTGEIVQRRFMCPACRTNHVVSTGWGYNGNPDAPTLTPSILATGLRKEIDANGNWTGDYERDLTGAPLPLLCHSYVTDGRIQFLTDCLHAMAGQTVDLPDIN